MWPHVTMVTNFLDHKNRGLKKRWRRRQRERQKQEKFKISKTITLHLHYVFCTSATWNFLILTPSLWSRRTQHTHKKDLVLSYSTPENVVNIWQIKWNRIRPSLKFETVQNDFLSDAFCLLSSRNFATIATWHTTSPLCCTRFWAWRNSETD